MPILPLALALATEPPHLRAVRTARPPALDGVLDDEAWREAPATSAFTQKYPDEGAAPGEPTFLRVAYDDDALYIAFDCVQRKTPVRAPLTRRDRLVEGDWISVAIDTRGDRKSAFDFNVNAAGVLVDSVHFNDTDSSGDWDENWDARTHVTADGWSAEIRVPLRILRFGAAPVQSWGLEARRYVSLRQETDEWAFIPRREAGEVSHYGWLDDLRGLATKSPLELRPFVLGRARSRGATTSQLAHGTDFGASAGLDLKWHVTPDLTLDATLLPDFAQVEADQVVLNLTTYETYYPEKRPFFLEGTDVFSTPMQLLYTRRIGAAPAVPALRTAEQLVDVPQPATIYGASKLTGDLGRDWQIGTLSAMTHSDTIQAQLADGSRVSRVAAPETQFQVARAKRSIGDDGYVGAMVTATTHAPTTNELPVVANDPSRAPYQLCYDGAHVAPGSRCLMDAFASAVDWRWRSRGGDYTSGGQVGASLLEDGAARSIADGTTIRSGDPGAGGTAWLSKEGGEHWLWSVYGSAMGRKFAIDDLGYNPRANRYDAGGNVTYRTLEPWGPTRETSTRLEAYGRDNVDGLNLGRSVQASEWWRLRNYWSLWTIVYWRPAWFDDREMGDGAALQRAGLLGHAVSLSTDPRSALAVGVGTDEEALTDGVSLSANADVSWRVLPQLDVELLPQAFYSAGEPRYVGGGAVPGSYELGRLRAENVGATLRATYTFVPRLTLQTYAQMFLASGHYEGFSTAAFDPKGPRPIVRLDGLVDGAAPPPSNPDFQQGALNVNVVLRWEYRLGSLLYLVYTRSQSPQVTLAPGETGALSVGDVGRAPAADALLLKLSYWWAG